MPDIIKMALKRPRQKDLVWNHLSGLIRGLLAALLQTKIDFVFLKYDEFLYEVNDGQVIKKETTSECI
jgi:hypothetical protein